MPPYSIDFADREGGRGSQNPKILWTSYLEPPYFLFVFLFGDSRDKTWLAHHCHCNRSRRRPISLFLLIFIAHPAFSGRKNNNSLDLMVQPQRGPYPLKDTICLRSKT